MNAKLIVIAIALIVTTTTAIADTSDAGKTAVEVREELEQAHAQGQLRHPQEFVDFTNVATDKSRAQVRAEIVQPQPRINSAYVEPPRITGGKSREEVRAEVEQAYASGQLGHGPDYVDFVNVEPSKSSDEVR